MAIFLKDTSAADLNAVIEFIYKGSVNVAQSQLASFIKTAEMLQIRGLSGDEENRVRELGDAAVWVGAVSGRVCPRCVAVVLSDEFSVSVSSAESEGTSWSVTAAATVSHCLVLNVTYIVDPS